MKEKNIDNNTGNKHNRKSNKINLKENEKRLIEQERLKDIFNEKRKMLNLIINKI